MPPINPATVTATNAVTSAMNQAIGSNAPQIPGLNTLLTNALGGQSIPVSAFQPGPGLSLSPREMCQIGGAAFGAMLGSQVGGPMASILGTQFLQQLGVPPQVVQLFQQSAPILGAAGGAAVGAAAGYKFGTTIADTLHLP